MVGPLTALVVIFLAIVLFFASIFLPSLEDDIQDKICRLLGCTPTNG